MFEAENFSDHPCKSVLLEGFRRWKGSFWLHKETLTFKGPAA
jgi:hypothetical protein